MEELVEMKLNYDYNQSNRYSRVMKESGLFDCKSNLNLEDWGGYYLNYLID
jgi:hypothetical protein